MTIIYNNNRENAVLKLQMWGSLTLAQLYVLAMATAEYNWWAGAQVSTGEADREEERRERQLDEVQHTQGTCRPLGSGVSSGRQE